MTVNLIVVRLHLLSRRSNRFVLLRGQGILFEADAPLLGPDEVDISSNDRSPEVDEIVQIVCCSMMEKASTLLPAPYFISCTTTVQGWTSLLPGKNVYLFVYYSFEVRQQRSEYCLAASFISECVRSLRQWERCDKNRLAASDCVFV